MAVNTDKNSYTIIFAVAMVLVVGSLLAFTASSLRPNIDENKRMEKQQNILYAMGVNGNEGTGDITFVGTDKVAGEFTKYIKTQLVIENGVAKVNHCNIVDGLQYCTSLLLNKNGQSLFPEDTWISDYREGIGYVSVGKEIRGKNRYALAKMDGTFLTDFIYKKITAPFENGHFIAKKGKKRGILTIEGKWFQPIKKMNYDRYDYLIGSVSDKDDFHIICFIDMNGNVILPLKKRGFTELEGGIIKERVGGNYSEKNEVFAYYSRKGKLLDLSEYDEVGEFQWISIK